MEILSLRVRGVSVAELPLSARPIAVGRARSCDVVISHPSVAPQQWLLVQRQGTVQGFDLTRDGGRPKPWTFPLDRELAIGDDHSLRRISIDTCSTASGVREPRTEPLRVAHESIDTRLFLRVGRGPGARKVRLDDRPLRIGTAEHSDLVLLDRAVSAEHCRVEPGSHGLYLRDLGSRNGTFAHGVRVSLCDLQAGTSLRVGRTELSVIEEVEQGSSEGQPLMVAASEVMREVLGEAQRWSGLSWPVLILGESGVGKEGVAQALHQRGPRARMPFVALNAGGLPRELVESELFGHERGAFTGASIQHHGVFEQANGGTLFLDEIGELPLELQARLLRVLETGEIRRVGAETSQRVDVRLVCATHRDLHTMVDKGTFRRDLYYRIARLLIEVPALRERPEDIVAIAHHVLRQIAPEVGKRRLTDAALSQLVGYGWPGNVRELRNVLSAAALSSSSDQVDSIDIEHALRRLSGLRPTQAIPFQTLQSVVASQNGNLAAAARVLGVARSTLRDRMRTGT